MTSILKYLWIEFERTIKGFCWYEWAMILTTFVTFVFLVIIGILGEMGYLSNLFF